MENNESEGIVNPTSQGEPNPAKIFIEWKSKNEKFSYYSKQKKEQVTLPMPFSFIPLFRCITVKGYNHKKTKTFIANEIIDLETDILTVTSYNNITKEKKIEHKGLYADIKDNFDQNIKYTESIYAAVKNKKGELSLVNMQLNGGGLTHWFSFVKENTIWGASANVKSFTDEINGDVNFKAPVYFIGSISKEDNIACGRLQKEIKTYLTKYFAKNANQPPEASKTSTNEQKEVNKEAAFDDSKHKDAQASKTTVEEEKVPDIVFGDADAPDDF